MPDLDASWLTVSAPLCIAILAIAIPGTIVVWALRLRGLAAVALAPVASVALWAGAGVLTQLTGPFTLPWTMFSLTAIVVAIGWIVGRGSARRFTATRSAALNAWWLAATMFVGAIAMAVLSSTGIASPALPNQTYDGIFHENLTLWIQSTGQESAFQAYHITDPEATNAFYPNAWHLLALIVTTFSGASMPTTFAALWIAVCGAIWLPGVVWATDVILQPANRTLVLATSALAATAFPSFPYLLLNWGTLYPTALAMSLMPAGLALLILATRAIRRLPGLMPWPVILIAGLGWLLALAIAHPRTFFTFAVLAVPYLVWQWISAVRAGLAGPRRRVAILGLVIPIVAFLGLLAAATVVILHRYTGGGRAIEEHLNGGPATAHFSLWEGLWQALAIAPPSSPGDVVIFPSILLGVVTIAAAVLAATRTETRWLLFAWGAVWVLYLLAATSNSEPAKLLTGVWYKDKYRILAALPIVAVPMLGSAMDRLVAVAGRTPRRRALRMALGAAAIVAVASWVAPTLPQLAARTGAEYDASGSTKGGRFADADDMAVLEEAASIIPPGERLLDDPWQGGILSWAVAGIEPVFPHFTGSWDADRRLVAKQMQTASAKVCAALDRLDAHYLFVDDEQTPGRAAGAQSFPGLAAAGASSLGPVVASSGSAQLIEITACG